MATTDNQIQYAGEYKVEKLKLHTARGSYDLTKTFVQIDLFENIFSHSMSGSLIFIDTDNLVINSPIVGQEYLELKISSPGIAGADSIDFSENVLSIYKIGYVSDVSKSSQMIEVHLISPEFLKNQRLRVSKSYQVKTNDQIIEDVLTNTEYIDTKKNVFIEPTKGSRNIISPNYHPFDLIKILTTESNNTSFINSEVNFHVFYENTQGYHFKSLSHLFSRPTNGDFHCGDVSTIEKDAKDTEDFTRVIQHQRSNSNDMLQNIVSGLLGSNLTIHDLYSKKYENYGYNYFDSFSEGFPRIDDNPVYYDDFIDNKNRTVGDFSNARIHLSSRSGQATGPARNRGNKSFFGAGFIEAREPIMDQDYKTQSRNQGDISSLGMGKQLLARRAKFAELSSLINYNIKVTGHTSMRVGEMINFSVPTVGHEHGEGGEDKYLSGRYLVKQLRHTFYRSPKKHEVSMSISKDSLGSSLPKGDIVQPEKTGKAFITRVRNVVN